MNKVKLIIILFICIIVFCIVGTFFVQGSVEVFNEEDILSIQNAITDSISIYGYTIDNPKVLIDPYNENYNTALIMFETEEFVSINVNVNDIYSYETNINNRHYIGVYNLVNGYNYIILSYGNKSRKIELNISEEGNKINMEDAIILSNNHLLVPTYEYVDSDIYTGIREIDVLGKIYYEYLIEDGYKGLSCEIDEEKLAILSNNLIIIDRQNGDIVSSFDISNYIINWLGMEYTDDKIILYGDNITISIDMDGNISEIEGNYNKRYLSGDINYNNNKGIRFYKELITKTSDSNVWLLNYEKEMNSKIDIKKEFNRIIVSGEDINECNTYLILDKLFDKRVYELCDKDNYIYTGGLKGKYSIYFKIDDKVYKTDKYLKI